MNEQPIVFIVDDQPGEIRSLVRRIGAMRCDVELATNEMEAKAGLKQVKEHPDRYVAGIFDIMVATVDFETLLEMDDDVDLREEVLEPSINTGVRLIDYARDELGLGADVFPIAALTARDDSDIEPLLKERGVPLYRRGASDDAEQSIMKFLHDNLRPRV